MGLFDFIGDIGKKSSAKKKRLPPQ